ncbi:Ubiquitin-like-specific protease 2 [Porphyridium purpureum]|uniref:Ubiquitin-like-specific protease 2 n=1 Tax=Porphyridium purpureum TaxID=35688 RepID=A0A5J4YNV1_PORPP|nr:Ubiquitin-like-specific protease 2 [Porphyridium purpureum]|eukprot:POR7884..scf296_7
MSVRDTLHPPKTNFNIKNMVIVIYKSTVEASFEHVTLCVTDTGRAGVKPGCASHEQQRHEERHGLVGRVMRERLSGGVPPDQFFRADRMVPDSRSAEVRTRVESTQKRKKGREKTAPDVAATEDAGRMGSGLWISTASRRGRGVRAVAAVDRDSSGEDKHDDFSATKLEFDKFKHESDDLRRKRRVSGLGKAGTKRSLQTWADEPVPATSVPRLIEPTRAEAVLADNGERQAPAGNGSSAARESPARLHSASPAILCSPGADPRKRKSLSASASSTQALATGVSHLEWVELADEEIHGTTAKATAEHAPRSRKSTPKRRSLVLPQSAEKLVLKHENVKQAADAMDIDVVQDGTERGKKRNLKHSPGTQKNGRRQDRIRTYSRTRLEAPGDDSTHIVPEHQENPQPISESSDGQEDSEPPVRRKRVYAATDAQSRRELPGFVEGKRRVGAATQNAPSPEIVVVDLCDGTLSDLRGKEVTDMKEAALLSEELRQERKGDEGSEDYTGTEAASLPSREATRSATPAAATEGRTADEDHAAAAQKAVLVFPFSGERGAVPILPADLDRIKPGEFANDSLIDFYLKFYWWVILGADRQQDVYFFSSFFFPRLTRSQATKQDTLPDVVHDTRRHSRLANGFAGSRSDPPPPLIDYEGVRRWTSDVDLFTKQVVFVPVCSQSHWNLYLITNLNLLVVRANSNDSSRTPDTAAIGASPQILVFDSLPGNSHAAHVAQLEEYIAHEMRHRRPDDFTKLQALCGKTSGQAAHTQRLSPCLGIDTVIVDVPQQSNFIDCGFFLMMSITYFFRDHRRQRALLNMGRSPERRKKAVALEDWYTHDMVDHFKVELEDLILGLASIQGDLATTSPKQQLQQEQHTEYREQNGSDEKRGEGTEEDKDQHESHSASPGDTIQDECSRDQDRSTTELNVAEQHA